MRKLLLLILLPACTSQIPISGALNHATKLEVSRPAISTGRTIRFGEYHTEPSGRDERADYGFMLYSGTQPLFEVVCRVNETSLTIAGVGSTSPRSTVCDVHHVSGAAAGGRLTLSEDTGGRFESESLSGVIALSAVTREHLGSGSGFYFKSGAAIDGAVQTTYPEALWVAADVSKETQDRFAVLAAATIIAKQKP